MHSAPGKARPWLSAPSLADTPQLETHGTLQQRPLLRCEGLKQQQQAGIDEEAAEGPEGSRRIAEIFAHPTAKTHPKPRDQRTPQQPESAQLTAKPEEQVHPCYTRSRFFPRGGVCRSLW